jgi:probable phosphoglycerate mutase
MANLHVENPSICHSKHRQFINISSYPSGHWALEPYTLMDPKVIALVRFEQLDYAVFLHPEDKRGYRSLVRLINNDQMISTLNREYTSTERIGLALTMALVTEAYTRFVPIAQNSVAGNNAHSFDSKTGTIQLGSSQEPIFLHGHVFGRGNPEEKYVEDVQLDGPMPGVIFDMRAQSPQEPGNDKKVHWKSGEMSKVVRRLKAEIENIHDVYKAHGLTIITRNASMDIYLVRHGETDWNIEKKLQGHSDIPLNERGKLQAYQLQKKFADINFIQVFSSDMIRARVTAEIILGSKKSTIIETPLLRERFMGTWQGRLATELQCHLKQTIDLDNLTQEEFLSVKWDDTAETYADIYQRLRTFIRSIAISPPENNDHILLSTHGGVLLAVLNHLDFQPGFRWKVANGAFLKLRVQAGGSIVITASDGVKLVEIKDTASSF